ncbi:MAG: GlgB N-terminal domain-containing protein, partial [Acidithiobacillus sp.]
MARAPLTEVMDDNASAILEARHADPFAWLGQHPLNGGYVQRVFLPTASQAEIVLADGSRTLELVDPAGLFTGHSDAPLPVPYLLRWQDLRGRHERHDPYTFLPQLSDLDIHLFNEGRLLAAYEHLGAHRRRIDGVPGVCFAVWAPNAERVSVVGDFNGWDGRAHPMRSRGQSGLWELFIPDLDLGELYKFELRHRETGRVFTKTDPYAQAFELRPSNAARVTDSTFQWQDAAWLEARSQSDWQHAPMSIY